jgi:hypothetical protein
MSNFPDTFNTGDILTAAYFNQMIEAVLARLTAVSFDLINQSGTITAFTYDVPGDFDQILNLSTYLDNADAGTGGSNMLLTWTDMEDNLQSSYNISQNPNLGGQLTFSQSFKAKRGTQVIFTGVGGAGCVFSCGGALTIVKSVS